MIDFPKIAKKIERAIHADIVDRRGWRQEWDGFSREIQREIRRDHTEAIRRVLVEELANKLP